MSALLSFRNDLISGQVNLELKLADKLRNEFRVGSCEKLDRFDECSAVEIDDLLSQKWVQFVENVRLVEHLPLEADFVVVSNAISQLDWHFTKVHVLVHFRHFFLEERVSFYNLF